MTRPVNLTERQWEVLQWMLAYQRQHGMPPTVREIGDAFGITSPNGVICHMRALVRKGCVHKRTEDGMAYLSRCFVAIEKRSARGVIRHCLALAEAGDLEGVIRETTAWLEGGDDEVQDLRTTAALGCRTAAGGGAPAHDPEGQAGDGGRARRDAGSADGAGPASGQAAGRREIQGGV